MNCSAVNTLVGLNETQLEEGAVWLPDPTWFHSSNAGEAVSEPSGLETKTDLMDGEDEEETDTEIWLPHPNWLRPVNEDQENEYKDGSR